MRRPRLSILLLASLLFSSVSCQRSPAFKRDQEFDRPENTASYYSSRSVKSPTQRVEAMGQPKKRVVVLDFWNDTPVKAKDLGTFTADELRRGLHLTQRVILPEDLRSELSTEDFVHGDNVKVAQVIREGKRLGVSVVVIGRVTKAVFRQRGDDIGLLRQKQSLAAVNVELKVFDVGAGREIAASARSGETSSNAVIALDGSSEESIEYRSELLKFAIRNAVGYLIPDVLRTIEKMTWEGRIAKVAGNKVYVNAGRASGLVVGDILKVLASGDDIYDPASGAYLGRAKGQLKGTLEVTDFLGLDGAATDVHTGANFQEGDLVQLY